MVRPVLVRLRALLDRRRADREIDDELAYHLDRETERNRARGMSAKDAEYAARRALGNLTAAREGAREAARFAWLDQLGQDLRYTARAMLRNPGFSAAAILSLALGIGATGTLVGVVDALVLRNLPAAAPAQLYYLKRDEPAMRSYSMMTTPHFARFRTLAPAFTSVAGVIDLDRANLVIGGSPDPGQVRVAMVSGSYFPTLGLRAMTGRLFEDADDGAPGSNPVAVISERYWTRRFGGARDIAGRTFSLGGTTFTIVGVAPRGFTGDWIGHATDVWVPFSMFSAVNFSPLGPPPQVHRVIVRIAPPATAAQAQATLDVVAPALAAAMLAGSPNPSPAVAATEKLRVVLDPASKGFSPQRATFGPALRILLLIASLVLLVAGANVANLFLARSASRRREMAVRVALGAGAGRLVRQMLTEAIVVASIAAGVAIAFEIWASDALLRFVSIGGGGMFGLGLLVLDLRPTALTVGFTAALSASLALVIVVGPALRLPRGCTSADLTQRGAAAGGGRFVLGRLLVVAQVAVSLVLLVSASLLVRTLHNLRSRDLGYERRVVLAYTIPVQSGRRSREFPALADNLLRAVGALPGVRGASVSSAGLVTGIDGNFGASAAIRLEGMESKPGLSITRSAITPGFFATAGLRLVDGRDFSAADGDSASPRVAVINETLARFLYGSQRAVGKRIGFLNDVGTPREIVGVVRDATYNTAREDKLGMLYFDYRQRPTELGAMSVVARTDGDPRALAPAVERAIRGVDPALPVTAVETLDQRLDVTLVRERLLATLGEFFGVLAALLAAVGLYGVVAYSIARRTNEIGVRMALGAAPSRVLAMIAGENARLVLLGIALGVPASVAAARLVASQLYGLEPRDPVTFAGASVLLAAISLAAGLVPAHRAVRVDPATALRSD